MWFFLLIFYTSVAPTVEAQTLTVGLFPTITDLAMFKPIKSSSNCGFNSSETTYCMSSIEEDSLSTCTLKTCLIECCDKCGMFSPPYIDLDKDGVFSSSVFISSDLHPTSGLFKDSRNFQNGGFVKTKIPLLTTNFTFTSWIKQSIRNVGVLLDKEDSFTIILQEYSLIFIYLTNNLTQTINFQNIDFEQEKWHHFAFKVCSIEVDLFIDGIFVRSETLVQNLRNASSFLTIAQDSRGNGQYVGLLQDIRYYQKGLENREIVEAMTGNLPEVPYTYCHCPESHPRLAPSNYFYCMKNDATSNDMVLRLSENSHPPEYLVDGLISYWISEKVSQVTLEIDLKYANLQVYIVNILFYSPPPQGIFIERSVNFGVSFQPWQYYALDCVSTFKMANNGQLSLPNSVNCLQITNPKPSWENVMFETTSPGPENLRRPFGVPGCSDFNCSPLWVDFVRATNVRITLIGHSLVTHQDHQYFGVRRIVVGGACDCYGHGSDCTYLDDVKPHPKYLCMCDPRTFTQGEQCDQCLPLYNDKPFLRGTIFDANPCKICQCNGHADSCSYFPALDANPSSRDSGGGGVCNFCKHNTMGRYCEICKPLFYRPKNKNLSAVDVCHPCNCVGPGVTLGDYSCQKDDNTIGIEAGQCNCKKYVTGLQCTECARGYFQLSATNSEGCTQCNCNTAGTLNNQIICHISSGQCECKQNVIGIKCSNCQKGYYGLSFINPLGCYPCNCNPFGSLAADECHALTGQCFCKDKFEGRACDRCAQGFFGPNCQPCNCNLNGTMDFGTLCNKDTGQCSCKLYVAGNSCNKCLPGYFGLNQTNLVGCYACDCVIQGTLLNKGECDQSNGTCFCKKHVTGRTCNSCKTGTYGLSVLHEEGCTKCNCYARGTWDGDLIPFEELNCSSLGQCSCLPNVRGKSCNECVEGFYWNPDGLGCLPCACNQMSSVSNICNSNGSCTCKPHIGVNGMKCDKCKNGYFNFADGKCSPCGCNSAGSLLQVCDDLGNCTNCKLNVEGPKCNICKPGTTLLEDRNPFGCSGAPSQQDAPFLLSQTSRSLTIGWLPPDNLNGVLTKYELYRNNMIVYVGLDDPFTDINLKPYTFYSYHVVSHTPGGLSASVDKSVFSTDSDVPEGVHPCEILDIKDRSVIARWQEPDFPNGIILYYILESFSNLTNVVTHYTGLDFFKQVTGLRPYTSYNFTIKACTDKGCSLSISTSITTLSSTPDSQPAPYLVPLPGGTAVNVIWDSPEKPNGQIQFYEIFLRSDPFLGEGNLTASNLDAKNRSFKVENLKPFSLYEFRVVSYTSRLNSISSNWSRIRTSEAAPDGEYAIDPIAEAINSTAVKLKWNEPFLPNGIIVKFELYRYSSSSTRTPVLIFVTGEKEWIDNELLTYTLYRYSVIACNLIGCTNFSSIVSVMTNSSAPQGQSPPISVSSNSTSIELAWNIPSFPNGLLEISYVVELLHPVFSYPPPNVECGIRFPGFGYYQLDPSFIADSSTTKIELSFRTRYFDGLLFFAASKGQEDMIALEFREGRPWFIFDTESGVTAFTVSTNQTFNDNRWHNLLVTRSSREGKIEVDGIYNGSGIGGGSKNVIGQIVNVYIGSLPKEFKIIRSDNGSASLKRMSFIGCIKDFQYKSIPISFNSSLSRQNVSPLSSFCPIAFTSGLYFKDGGYLLLKPTVFKALSNFIFKVRLKTTKETALVFFSYGEGVKFFLYFQNAAFYLSFKTPTDSGLYTLTSVSICDGKWHSIFIENLSSRLVVSIDNNQSLTLILPSDFLTTSEVFLGGIPGNSFARTLFTSDNIIEPFSGCIDGVSIGATVYIPSNVEDFHNVEFDGCPQTSSDVFECKNPLVNEVYRGKLRYTVVNNLDHFTEYLVRVKSYREMESSGFGISEWNSIRSAEGVPKSFAPPTILSLDARSVKLSWFPPLISSGLIRSYVLHGYIPGIGKNVSDTVENRLVVESGFSIEGDLKNLIPSTLYLFYIEVFTGGGSTESETVNATTLPAAPEVLPPPIIVASPTSFNVSWEPPVRPNGEILFYKVELNDVLYYTGKDRILFIGNLTIYTLYMLKVSACGSAGCVSVTVNQYTGQLAPEGVIAPHVKVLDSIRIEVSWSPPSKPNGNVHTYQLYVSLSSSINYLKLMRNITGGNLVAVIEDLIPGSLYYVRVKAVNDGGSTISNASEVRMLESAPTGIPPPEITAIGSSILLVKIFPPTSPNGVVIKYSLFQDDILVLDNWRTVENNYLADNLKPYSQYVFQVQVCTANGCGLSDKTIGLTGHGKPNGSIQLFVQNVSSHSFTVNWRSFVQPNGPLIYNFLVKGEFLVDNVFGAVNKSLVCLESNITDGIALCTGLLAYTTYDVIINASNKAGFLLSNSVIVETLSDVPQEISSINCSVINSTSVFLSWIKPLRPNGKILSYYLYIFFQPNDMDSYREVLIKSGLFFNYTVRELSPYTMYRFRIEVENTVGRSTSSWKNVTTDEDAPSKLDAPKVTTISARSAILYISSPVKSNGIILNYNVFLNFTLVFSSLQMMVNLTNLRPFTVYKINVGACTRVGCINSSDVIIQTLMDAPEDVYPPILSLNGSHSVQIQWREPGSPNGIILLYTIQRRKNGSDLVETVHKNTAQFWNIYIDSNVKPYTLYEYRIVAETSAGATQSHFSVILTPEAEPEGMERPTVIALSANSVLIKWHPPNETNGEIKNYIVKIGVQVIELNNSLLLLEYTATGLIPYALYYVRISACTIAGCTESSATSIRTLPAVPTNQPAPTALVLSSTSLRVHWTEPLFPNGPIIAFILHGRTVESLVNENINFTTSWQNLVFGITTVFDHLNLGIFSSHEYMVTCITSEGNVSSNISQTFRTGPGIPLSGPQLAIVILNNTSVKLSWVDPPLSELQGNVLKYTVFYELVYNNLVYRFGSFLPNTSSIVVNNLRPNTEYDFKVELFNGAGSFVGQPKRVKMPAGVPEEFGLPVVYRIGSFDVSIAWSAPMFPNGLIENYTVVINNSFLDTVSGDVLFHQQERLKPYTFYIIKIQVCTQFGCILSGSTSATTLSAAPSGMEAPSVWALSSTSLQIEWKPPLNKNGILTGYKVYQRSFLTCTNELTSFKKCSYIECNINESICGIKCYDPQYNVCCNQSVYEKNPQKFCCNNAYITKNSTSDICCGDSFFPFQVNYQCCYDHYKQVPDGHICCSGNSGVIVGIGNSCCGDVPYDVNGTKVCLCGGLYERNLPAPKCCGGKIISSLDICCGNEIKGIGYHYDPTKKCCGTGYFMSENMLCCANGAGDVEAYLFNSSASLDQHKCCGINSINSTEACCNSVAYNNGTHICADLSSNAVTGCGNGTTCLRSSQKTALCDSCHFNISNSFCFETKFNTIQSNLCMSDFKEVLNNSQNASILTFIDHNLIPHTKYEYYIMVFNDAGNVSSATNSSTTEMGQPENLESPVPTVLSYNSIFVTWSLPKKPNGQISEYILYRSKWSTKEERIVYKGLGLSFLDMDELDPNTGYLYILSACTVSCSNISASFLVYTEESIPTGVQPPLLKVLSSTSIQVNWSLPIHPNGKIIFYNVTILLLGEFRSLIPKDSLGEMMSLIVNGLLPFTSYTFRVYACSVKGCGISSLANITTFQAAPDSILPPQAVVVSARKVELSWSSPKVPNGVILFYILKRNLTVIYNGTQLNFTDVSISPATIYSYTVGVSTLGGNAISSKTDIMTPESSPEGIAVPFLYAISSSSINVSWSLPDFTNGVLISFSVYYQETDSFISKKSAGMNLSMLINGLKTFTLYLIRVEACTIVGCGLSDKAAVRTLEEPPIGQQPPTLVARSTSIVEVSWVPPDIPNGIISSYQVERRSNLVITPDIIYIGSRNDYIDTQLIAYTEYEYRVRSINSKGESLSEWRKVRTFEGIPENVQAPFVEVLNSSSIYAKWNPPSILNGILVEYTLQFRLFSQTQSINVLKCCIKPSVREVQVDGLLPFTSYEFRVVASTSVGSGYSPWTFVRMPEALPNEIPELKIRILNDSNSLEASWEEPHSSNGVITSYILLVDSIKVYEGILRRAVLRKVLPFTNYTFQLKVCNSVGCALGLKQIFQSGDIVIKVLPTPRILFLNASVVQLNWKVDINSNISSYQVIREELSMVRKKRSAGEVTICSMYNISTDIFQCTDTSVKPYKKYRYRVIGINDQSIIESSWVEVLTAESVPEYVLKPNLTVLVGSSIYIQWSIPPIPNGIIRHYEVVRNGSFIVSTLLMFYIDINNLKSNTMFEYAIKACTSVGCTLSASSYVTTLGFSLDTMLPPVLRVLGSTVIMASWTTPLNTSSDIVMYRLFINKGFTPIFEGYAFMFTLENLKPFTKYLLNVAACSLTNCVISETADALTKEAPPESLLAPILYVLGTNSLEVRWTTPAKPNGVILFYVLKRDNITLYNGTDTAFIDYKVYPGSTYGYNVAAYNSAGRAESDIAYGKPADIGFIQNISVPILEAIGSTEINVTWVPPNSPNNIITTYILLYDDTELNVGMVFQYVVKNLIPFTKYSFRIKACFNTNCVTSQIGTVKTLEATPENQRAPYFISEEIQVNSIIVRWDYPLKPNGVIKYCELFRRKNNIVQVYKGLSTLFLDDSAEILPNTRYEYKVSCNNSVGGASSLWSAITTSSTPAEDTISLVVTNKTSTSFSYELLLTSQLPLPIINFVIEISNFNFKSNFTTENTRGNISGLQPYTEYMLRVYGCNEIGCVRTKLIKVLQTEPAAPQGFDFFPEVLLKNSREIEIKWEEPKYPNGLIIEYDVLLHHPCPQPSKPTNCVAESFSYSSGTSRAYKLNNLTPYTDYEIKITAFNSVAGLDSQVLKITTDSEVPVVVQQPLVGVADDEPNTIILSWADVFDLRSKLEGYFVTENKLLAYSGTSTTNLTRPNRTAGYYSYIITAVTLVNNTKISVSTSEVVVFVGDVPTTAITKTPSAGTQSSDKAWYQTVWFLALCAFAFVLVMFIFIVCCCRGYRKNQSVYVREREPLPSKLKYKSRASSLNEFLSPKSTPHRRLGSERYNDVSMSHNSTPKRGHFKDGHFSGRKINNSYVEDDLIWDAKDSRRDLDSGLYDDFNAANFDEEEFVNHPVRDRTFTTSHQSERFVLPDTRL